MKYEIKTTCSFGQVQEEKASGGPASDRAARQTKKVGHYYIRHNGRGWQSIYLPDNAYLQKAPLTAEVGRVYRFLLEELFPGRDGLQKLRGFCALNPGAATKGREEEYNFFINGRYANFWIQAATRDSDCHLCIHVFAK